MLVHRYPEIADGGITILQLNPLPAILCSLAALSAGLLAFHPTATSLRRTSAGRFARLHRSLRRRLVVPPLTSSRADNTAPCTARLHAMINSTQLNSTQLNSTQLNSS